MGTVQYQGPVRHMSNCSVWGIPYSPFMDSVGPQADATTLKHLTSSLQLCELDPFIIPIV